MYIDKDGNLYQGDIQVGDKEATEEEIKKYQDKQELTIKLAKAHSYLDKTDHKELPRYKPKDNEDLEAIFAKRDELIAFIRANK